MGKRFLICSLSILFWGCTQWETKKVPTETYFAQQWELVDITEVDAYPAFPRCTAITERALQKDCFEAEITSVFQDKLSEQTYTVTQDINDPVWIDLIIDTKGKVCIDSLHINAMTRLEIPELPIVINEVLQDFSIAKPAIKKGNPVKTKFRLPIILSED